MRCDLRPASTGPASTCALADRARTVGAQSLARYGAALCLARRACPHEAIGPRTCRWRPTVARISRPARCRGPLADRGQQGLPTANLSPRQAAALVGIARPL